jgi:hypothetical protein
MYINYNYLSATGEVYNHAGGLRVSEAGDQINRHQICALDSDFYVTWTDGGSYRAEQCNIFMQRINNPYVGNQDELAPAAEINPVITAYPNPFRQNLSLQIKTNHAATADISVYNLKGQKVRSLIRDELLSKGTHDFSWNGLDSSGTSTASGIYFLRSKLDGKASLIKLLKVK